MTDWPWKYCALCNSPLSGPRAPLATKGFIACSKLGKVPGCFSLCRATAWYILKILALQGCLMSARMFRKTVLSGSGTYCAAGRSVFPGIGWKIKSCIETIVTERTERHNVSYNLYFRRRQREKSLIDSALTNNSNQQGKLT